MKKYMEKIGAMFNTMYPSTMYPDGKAHGRTALIIKSNIKHYEIDKFQMEYLQATSIVIEWPHYYLSNIFSA